MSDNSTFDTLDVTLEQSNTTLNDTSTPSTTAQSGFFTVGFFLLEAKLVLSAIGIIWVGAHAALRRPPSAAKRTPKDGKESHHHDDENIVAQGLLPSDAIVFPVMAGIMLVGLYYLIQWLKDPEILNKILRYYMSTISIASLLTLYAHGLEVGISFLLPSHWRGRDGKMRKADQRTNRLLLCDEAGRPTGSTADSAPTPWSRILLLKGASEKALWSVRSLLTGHAFIKLFVIRLGGQKLKVKLSHILALIFSLLTAVVYFTTNSTFLSNMLGYGMCYGSFLVLSPTDLLTSSLVLCGLFFYDIVMVFYTPYMITVATTLDVPIKLQFEAASRKSILGLGDIVIPGMVMAWALRLDLWLHYLNKVKYESTSLKMIAKDKHGAVVETSETKHKEVKLTYVKATGNWGEKFWLRGPLFLRGPQALPPEVAATRFTKTYFNATLVGYFLGMLVTLSMLVIFQHGQPALLYLVPGVLGSIYVTALARGELKKIWSYTEDGSLDKVDVVVDLDAEGRAIKSLGVLQDGVVDTTKSDQEDEKTTKDTTKSQGVPKKDERDVPRQSDPDKMKTKTRHLFQLSIDLPSEDEA